MRRIFQRRYPAYFGGFILGLTAVLLILQMKKTFAPNFEEMPDKRLPIRLIAGGSLRLKLGADPGKLLVWGFPTQLAVGRMPPMRLSQEMKPSSTSCAASVVAKDLDREARRNTVSGVTGVPAAASA